MISNRENKAYMVLAQTSLFTNIVVTAVPTAAPKSTTKKYKYPREKYLKEIILKRIPLTGDTNSLHRCG